MKKLTLILILLMCSLGFGAVSYNATDDLITITGGTESSPITWSDVYADASVSSSEVDECVTDAMYIIDCNVAFGDGTTETHFLSENDSVYFNDDYWFTVKSNSNLSIGTTVASGYSTGSAVWSFNFDGSYNANEIMPTNTTGNLRINGSLISIRNTNANYYLISGSSVVIQNSVINSSGKTTGGYFYFIRTNWTIKDVYISDSKTGIKFDNTPVSAETVWIHNCDNALLTYNDGAMSISDVKITSCTRNNFGNSSSPGSEVSIVNPASHLNDMLTYPAGHGNTEDITREVYSVEIEVLNNEGPVEGASVTYYQQGRTDTDNDGNLEEESWGSYSLVGSETTDADGHTPEIDFTWSKWEGTDEIQTDYRYKIIVTHSNHAEYTIKDLRINSTNIPLQLQFERYHSLRRDGRFHPPLYKQSD